MIKLPLVVLDVLSKYLFAARGLPRRGHVRGRRWLGLRRQRRAAARGEVGEPVTWLPPRDATRLDGARGGPQHGATARGEGRTTQRREGRATRWGEGTAAAAAAPRYDPFPSLISMRRNFIN